MDGGWKMEGKEIGIRSRWIWIVDFVSVDEVNGVPSTPSRASGERQLEDTLEAEKDMINKDLQIARKRLKPQASFSSDYWFQRTSLAKKLQSRADFKRKISLRDFKTSDGGDEQAWLDTPEAKKLIIEMKTHNLEERLCEKQAKRLETEPSQHGKSLRRCFMQMFTISPLGLGAKNTGMGKRDTRAQSSFRKELIRVSNAAHPNPREQLLWCSITNRYHDEGIMTAAHIFAYRNGQEMMTAIFGAEDPPELFSPRNAILMHSKAEEAFDKGLLLIVPYVPNDSPAEIQRWHQNEPKEYRIRVCEPNAPMMQYVIPGDTRTWKDLDGSRLEFKGNASDALRDELGKLYWGTPGRFMPKNMLLAFVEEMGHEYEELLEAAMGGDAKDDAEVEAEAGVEAVETALAAANHQIVSTMKKDDEEEDESDEDDENDEEGDDRI